MKNIFFAFMLLGATILLFSCGSETTQNTTEDSGQEERTCLFNFRKKNKTN
jgi:hypothetical protein